MSQHAALTEGRAAVITGAASGIGLAAALRFAELGMRVCLADLGGAALEKAAAAVATVARRGVTDVRAIPTDVSDRAAVERLKDAAYTAFGEVAVLMNNAGTAPGGGPWEHHERWRRVLDVNLWGVINGVQSFTQAMIDQGTPAAIVNTGSKQGITCPPGDTAYNVSKAGVKVLTEGLAHSLRNVEGCRGERASAGAGLDLHRHDARQCDNQAAGRLEAGAGDRPAARRHGSRRLLHHLSRQ